MSNSTAPHLDGIPLGKIALVAASAAMGGFLFGFDTAVINGAVDAIRDWSGAASWLLGFAVAGALLGSAIGAWFAGPLADRHGRIAVMKIAAAIFFASSIGTGLAWDIMALSVFRFLGGTAIGAASVIAPAYIAEVSPVAYRGRLGSLQQLAIVTGIFIALLSDFALARSAGGAVAPLWFGLQAWRWMFIAAAIPSAIYAGLAGMIRNRRAIWCSESAMSKPPPSLAGSSAILRRSRSGSSRSRRASATSELAACAIWPVPVFGLLPVVWTGILLSVFQQFVGINVIFYYSATLWHAGGFTQDDALGHHRHHVRDQHCRDTGGDRADRSARPQAASDRRLARHGLDAWRHGLGVRHSADRDGCRQRPTPARAHSRPGRGHISQSLCRVLRRERGGRWCGCCSAKSSTTWISAYALAVAAAAQWIANYIVSQTFPALAGISLGLAYGTYTVMVMLSLVFVLAKVRETRGLELEEMT